MKRTGCMLLAAVFLLGGLLGLTGCDESLLEQENTIAPATLEQDGGQDVSLTADEVPLARHLAKMYQGRRDSSLVLDLVQHKSKDNATIWSGKLHGSLQEMTDAGVLPSDLLDRMRLYSSADTANYTVMTDALGGESITCHFNMDPKIAYFTTIYEEPGAGKAFEVSGLLPFTYPVDEDGRDSLTINFIKYLGLDVFTDWEKVPYQPSDGDLPSRDYSSYLVLYNSKAAGLRVSLEWHNDEDDYLLFSYECSAEPYELPG